MYYAAKSFTLESQFQELESAYVRALYSNVNLSRKIKPMLTFVCKAKEFQATLGNAESPLANFILDILSFINNKISGIFLIDK